MPSLGIEHAILATKSLQNYALDCMATATGHLEYWSAVFKFSNFSDKGSTEVLSFNPYPANVDNMAISFQSQQMADGI